MDNVQGVNFTRVYWFTIALGSMQNYRCAGAHREVQDPIYSQMLLSIFDTKSRKFKDPNIDGARRGADSIKIYFLRKHKVLREKSIHWNRAEFSSKMGT
jgi:hypothetical protein